MKNEFDDIINTLSELAEDMSFTLSQPSRDILIRCADTLAWLDRQTDFRNRGK